MLHVLPVARRLQPLGLRLGGEYLAELDPLELVQNDQRYIKVKNKNFYAVDFNNVLKSFSIGNGSLNWEYKSENTLIKSKKKLLNVDIRIILIIFVNFFNIPKNKW